MSFVLWFKDVKNNADSIFVIISDDSLVSIRSIGLDNTTLFLTGFCWLMIFQLNSFWIQNRRIFSKQK